MRKSNKYLLFLTIILVGLLYDCERVDPAIDDGVGESLMTIVNRESIRLDTNKYQYLGVIDQNYIFEFQGEPDQFNIGDLIFYHKSAYQVFGEVEEYSLQGQVLQISLKQVPLNAIFDHLALKNDLSDFQIFEDQFFNSKAISMEDTILFEPLEYFWNDGSGNWGLLKIDSLKLFNLQDGIQEYYLGPKWEEGIRTHKIELRLNQNHHISTIFDLVVKGEIDVKDSLRIRERWLRPYDSNSTPVYYEVDEWIRIEVNSSGDNQLRSQFTIDGLSSYTASYQDDKGWRTSQDNTPDDENIESFIWDNKNSAIVSFSLITIITPVIYGIPGLEMQLANKWQTSTSIEWPVWNFSMEQILNTTLISNNSAFGDLPQTSVNHHGPVRELLSDNGELENNSPVAEFTVTPGFGYTITNFEFDASKSYDLEDDINDLQVRWDFNGDEEWDTNYSYEKIVLKIFPVPGNYNTILEVMDSQGAISQVAKNINVQETSSTPTASFTVSPEHGRTSDIFSFDASGSWDGEDDPGMLKVRWDYDGDDIWDTSFSTSKAGFFVYPTPGTYRPKLEVMDTQGLSGWTTRFVEVEAANIKPTAYFTISPEEGTIDTNFLFDGSGSSDPEDELSELQVRWDFENDGQWDTEYRTVKTVNHRFPIAANYTVVLQVMDTDDYSNTFTRELLVSNPNTPPNADFSISPPEGDTTTIFIFDGSISTDLEDSIEGLLFRWDYENDDIYDTEFSSNPILKRSYSETGTVLIKMQAMDSGGLKDEKTRLVIIK